MKTPFRKHPTTPSWRLLPVLCCLSLGTGLATLAVHAADKPMAASGAAPAAATAMAKTGTQFKADADMQAVLDELAALGGKPIESLTPSTGACGGFY